MLVTDRWMMMPVLGLMGAGLGTKTMRRLCGFIITSESSCLEYVGCVKSY